MRRMLFDNIELRMNAETIVIKSVIPFKILSSAPVGGGLSKSSTIVILKVDKNFDEDPAQHFKYRQESIGCGEAVCLMTAADLTKAEIVEQTGSFKVAVVVTAGVSNASTVCDAFPIHHTGTINIVVLIDRDLTEGCMANIIMTATEAKCKALASLDIRSVSSGQQATGTSSDAILVASTGKGEALKYAGSATELGRIVGSCVEKAVRSAVIKHDNLIPERSLLCRLEERGITTDDLISTAAEMFVPSPHFTWKEARPIFEKYLLEAMNDINVSALVIAAFRLNEDGERGLIPGINKKCFDGDPVHIVADEILGISIAQLIAGYYGLFEFYRFDRKKPGILSKLPPFVDDVIGALIAGASSKMYWEILQGK